jgi:DNA-binding IclR family transcriptional regulator
VDTSGPPSNERLVEHELNPKRSSLLRGLVALEALAIRPMSAAELARLLDVNRSTTLRLMRELEASGYVKRDGSGRRYATATDRFQALLIAHSDQSNWSPLVEPLLASIRDEFGESSMAAVPAGGLMVYTSLLPSRHSVVVREWLGTARPMHCSALGKAYLAARPVEQLDLELGRLSYEGGTASAAHGPIELRERLDEARELGYAVDHEETLSGVVCVAVPLSIRGTLVGAAGVSAPLVRFDDNRLHAVGRTLKTVFAQIA